MAQITKLLGQDTVDTYLSMFETHADHIRRHQAGVDEWKSIFPTSVIEPRTTWTSEEKSAFFRGLSVYSRLRPDLIAESICHNGGQKSAADVGAYIAVLERASCEKGRPRNWRANMPAARVLTKRWRLFEEECADMLLMGEAAAERHAVEERRKAQLKDEKLGEASISHEVGAMVDHALKRKREDEEESGGGILGSDTESRRDFDSSHGRENGGNVDQPPSERDERAAKRRHLREQWMREDIFRNLDHTRVLALRGIYQHREKLQGDSSSQGTWISPIGKLALSLGYTPEALERDGMTLVDWYALWKSTARLKWAFMDSRLQYRTQAGITTLLPTERKPQTMKEGGAIQYKTLQLLNAYLKSYVATVIHRAVVLKERFVKDRPWEVLRRYEKELSGADTSKDRSGPDWLDQQCIFKAIELVGKSHTPAKVFHSQVGDRLDLDLDVWPEEVAAKVKRKVRVVVQETATTGEVSGSADEAEALEEIGEAVVDESGMGAERPLKSKRGRPKKHPIGVGAALTPKRPRGRPLLPRDPSTGQNIRPSKVTNSEDVDIEIGGVETCRPEQTETPSIAPPRAGADDTTAAPTVGVDANIPPKRGRGRPRKDRAEPQTTASVGASASLTCAGITPDARPLTIGNDDADITRVQVGPYMSTKEKAKLREPPWEEARNIVISPLDWPRRLNPIRAARVLIEQDGSSEDNDDDDGLDIRRDINTDNKTPGSQEMDSEDELSDADRADDVEYEKLLWEQFGVSGETSEVDFIYDCGGMGVRGRLTKSKPFILSEDDEDFDVVGSGSDDLYEPS